MASERETTTTIVPAGLRKLEAAIFKQVEELGLHRNPMDSESKVGVEELRDLCLDLGERYCDASFSNYEIYNTQQAEVVAKLVAFSDDMRSRIRDGSGLLMRGKVGTGKDHLMAALLKLAIVRHRFSVLWFDGQKLFAMARQAIQRQDEEEFRRWLARPQILALSDPQPPKGDLSEYQMAMVRDIIDRRYRRGLSTWLTTNIGTRDTAIEALTEPVIDRLREGSLQVQCNWESHRERSKP
jgi:DNA replication protein DnaC